MSESVHTYSPTNAEFTLCGDAFDLDSEAGEVAPLFAKKGEIITCPKCRAVINHCKAIRYWREP